MSILSKEPTYQRLGSRAYWAFFFRKLVWFFSPLMLFIIVAVLGTSKQLEPPFDQLVEPVLGIIAVIFCIMVAVAFFIAWIEYLAFQFVIDEHALKIRSGIINIKIEAIPYRQMQNVDIERDILFRLLGVSRLVILTAGEEDPNSSNESEGIIPAIDKVKAHELQEELLRRSNVEKIASIVTPSI